MERRIRGLVVQGLAGVEDVVYAGLGVLLAAGAFGLLFTTSKSFIGALSTGTLVGQVPALLESRR